MKYKISVTLPSQSASLRERENGAEMYFLIYCENKKEALSRLHQILTRGVSQSIEYPDTHLLNSQTVFYPAHLIKRVSVEPPIPDFD